MTPSIVKNVIRMPKERAARVRTRISDMSAEQQNASWKPRKTTASGKTRCFFLPWLMVPGRNRFPICDLETSISESANPHSSRQGPLDQTQGLLKVKGNPLFNEAAAPK